MDLRDTDVENTRCLPIKLFYYLAAGRPVIYSDLKAIRKGVSEIISDSLVQSEDTETAAHLIEEMVIHPDRYKLICNRNRHLAENKYNWERISNVFVQFIETL